MKTALTAAVVAAIVATGSAGAARLGDTHLRVLRVVGKSVSVPANSTGFSWASCPAQMKVTGGGIAQDPFTSTPIKTVASYPFPSLSTWQTNVENPNAIPVTVQTAAVCVG